MERLRQRVGLPANGDLPLLHGLEHRGLGLGWCPVDLVGQDEIGEHRSRQEHLSSSSGFGIFLQDVRTSDVAGHQVGGELDAVELEVHRLTEGANEQCFGEARDPGDQRMATGKQCQQGVVDNLLLPDDDFADLLNQRLSTGGQLFDRGDGNGRIVGGIHEGGSDAETKDTRNRRRFQPQRVKYLQS